MAGKENEMDSTKRHAVVSLFMCSIKSFSASIEYFLTQGTYTVREQNNSKILAVNFINITFYEICLIRAMDITE